MKTFLKSTFLFALLSALTLSSCQREDSESVDQDTIYSEFELYYNSNEDKTYARATFKFSNLLSTKLELSDGAEVSFNGDLLSWKPALAYYEKEYAGMISTGEFTYVDLDGNTFMNTATLTAIDYPIGFDSLSLQNAYDLEWVGSALAAGEDVTVAINGIVEGDAQSFYTNAEGATNIVLDRDKLIQLGEGTSTVWMDRRSYGTHVGTSAGGYVVGRVRATNATPILY